MAVRSGRGWLSHSSTRSRRIPTNIQTRRISMSKNQTRSISKQLKVVEAAVRSGSGRGWLYHSGTRTEESQRRSRSRSPRRHVQSARALSRSPWRRSLPRAEERVCLDHRTRSTRREVLSLNSWNVGPVYQTFIAETKKLVLASYQRPEYSYEAGHDTRRTGTVREGVNLYVYPSRECDELLTFSYLSIF